jgi:pimeloyl-ACP methyl ester carboxylesterase
MRTVYPMDDNAWAIVPNLRGIIDVAECGHWTQQEHPEVVTGVLLEFLRGL